MVTTQPLFSSVYGPVSSWRFGRSLGIDAIGAVSTCSFDCVYCQLGGIEHHSRDRQVFVPTAQIVEELRAFAPWDVDVITLSGSGEPSLALNLGEILAAIKTLTGRSVGVLTNGSLLTDPSVGEDMAIADFVSIKLDAVTQQQFQRVNSPVSPLTLAQVWHGLEKFCRHYSGQLAVQTMVLSRWSEADLQQYSRLVKTLNPNEIHLNTTTRPRPLTHQLDARGNHPPTAQTYPVQQLKPISPEILRDMGDRIQAATGIPVKHAT